MKQLAEDNNAETVRVVAFDCDLAGSVKLNAFQSASPAGFVEAGIAEHNAATTAGCLSKQGFNVFLSTFGMFAVTEVHNQLRLNAYNASSLKVVATHCGLDVGEDGPTHQVVDYVALLNSSFNWEIFAPADANHCDRIVRAIADRPGNQFVGMSRSALPIIRRDDGTPFYDGDYVFRPGEADVVRAGDGQSGTVITFGAVAGHAVEAADRLHRETGRRVRVVVVGSLKPLDVSAIRAASAGGFILTVEDHNRDTGLGALVATVIAEEGLAVPLTRLGCHRFAKSGPARSLYRLMGIDADNIARVLGGLLARAN